MNMHFLHRAAIGAVLALALGSAPAVASVGDGTSNTILVAEATVDQAHHRVLVRGPGVAAQLAPGTQLRTAGLLSGGFAYTFENVMVESVTGTANALSLNFTKITYVTHVAFQGGCARTTDTCLMESDGIFWPDRAV
jgi:hypothetical protein